MNIDRHVYVFIAIISGLWAIALACLFVIVFTSILRYEEIIDPALGIALLWGLFFLLGIFIAIFSFVAINPLKLFADSHERPAMVLMGGIACYLLPAFLIIIFILFALMFRGIPVGGFFIAPFGFNLTFLGLIVISLAFNMIIATRYSGIVVITTYFLLAAMFVIYLIFFISILIDGRLSTYKFMLIFAVETLLGTIVNLIILVLSIKVLRLIPRPYPQRFN
jgi:hypothetical protein